MHKLLHKANRAGICLLVLTMILPLCIFIINPALAEEEPFAIETQGIYTYMDKPYGQGYNPKINRNTMEIVLPVTAREKVEEVEAVLSVPNWEQGIFKNKTQTMAPALKTYTINGEKKEVYLLHFPMALIKGGTNGDYPYTITLKAKAEGGGEISQEFNLFARATTLGATAEIPKIVLSEVTAKEPLEVGEEGEITLNVTNQSPAFLAENLIITLKDGKDEILPITGNRIEIPRLLPLEEKTVTLPVQVIAKGAAAPHTLESTLTYPYGTGKTQTITQNWTIQVVHQPNLHHTEAKLPMNVTQGETTGFTMTFMNMGKGDLYNVLATFTINGLASGGSVLAGNIEPGASKDINTNFNVSKELLGEVEGLVTITYEDAYGKTYQKELPLSTKIIEKMQPKVEEEIKEEKQNKERLQIIIPWAVALLLGALLLIQGIALRNKVKHLEEKNL